ncbi:MAG: DUF6278 family protein [Polyangiales bacterium]
MPARDVDPAPPPTEIADLADSCVRFVLDALGLQLDYTPETLPVLDHYLREGARGAKPEVLALLAPAAGAYFGETVRRNMAGARWHCPAESEYRDFRLEFDPFFLCFNPIGVAVEVLTLEDATGFGAHFNVLEEARAPIATALESSEGVDETSYYTFTMRWEALEQVANLLSALESKQAKRRRFGPEVYRAASGETGGSSGPLS